MGCAENTKKNYSVHLMVDLTGKLCIIYSRSRKSTKEWKVISDFGVKWFTQSAEKWKNRKKYMKTIVQREMYSNLKYGKKKRCH